jgi:hypothetical protein
MTEYRNLVFNSLIDRGNALTLSDIGCFECDFSNCALSLTKDIGKRALVSDVLLKDCKVSASNIGPAVLTRVQIDGLVTDSLLIIWGAVFDHVVFSGPMGKIKINRHVHHVEQSDSAQRPFDEFRHSFYKKVDWAIDISRAKVRLLELSGIPAKLIRRDPSTQMIVTRERALNKDWRSRVSAGNKHWPFVIEMFLSTGEADRVLVAPLVGPKKQVDKLIDELNELRDLGVVE